MDYLYNVGDAVVVKSNLRKNVDYHMKSGPEVAYGYNNATDEMIELAGTVVHIAKQTGGQYLIEEDDYSFCWTDEMFEPINEGECFCESLL